MTAAERLQALSGLSGVSAGTMLLAIGAGATAGAALVNYSGLDTGTAAEHLLTVRIIQQPITLLVGGGGGGLDENLAQYFHDDADLLDFLTVFTLFRSLR